MKTKIQIVVSVFLLSLCSVHAQTFEVNGINYNITSASEVEVINKTGCYTGDIVIPATVEDSGTTYNVIGIGDDAFNDCDITSINLPNSITYIGEFAFRDCRDITSITLPDSVTSIGYAAFLYCTELVSVNIPENVSVINQSTFSQCGKLTSITIPSSVTSIGTYAFSSCFSLATVNIYVPSPINITIHRFWNLDLSLIALNVPIGSESAYASSPVWQDFGTINGTLSTNEFKPIYDISISPNPVIKDINVTGLFTSEKYEIYDLNGKKVKEGHISNFDKINVGNLSNGLFILKLGNGITKKIIKK